jgi:hypothetical protein
MPSGLAEKYDKEQNPLKLSNAISEGKSKKKNPFDHRERLV